MSQHEGTCGNEFICKYDEIIWEIPNENDYVPAPAPKPSISLREELESVCRRNHISCEFTTIEVQNAWQCLISISFENEIAKISFSSDPMQTEKDAESSASSDALFYIAVNKIDKEGGVVVGTHRFR